MRGATGEPICPYSYLRTTEDTHASVSHPRPSASQRHQRCTPTTTGFAWVLAYVDTTVKVKSTDGSRKLHTLLVLSAGPADRTVQHSTRLDTAGHYWTLLRWSLLHVRLHNVAFHVKARADH